MYQATSRPCGFQHESCIYAFITLNLQSHVSSGTNLQSGMLQLGQALLKQLE